MYFLCCFFLFSVFCFIVFFLIIRRPPKFTLDRSWAASDVYKRQVLEELDSHKKGMTEVARNGRQTSRMLDALAGVKAVSYTHLRAHETVLDLVCRLLLEKKTLSYPHLRAHEPDVAYVCHIHLIQIHQVYDVSK